MFGQGLPPLAHALLRAEPRLRSTREISTPDPSALPLFDARIGIEWMVARMQSQAGQSTRRSMRYASISQSTTIWLIPIGV
mgnify:FL=1